MSVPESDEQKPPRAPGRPKKATPEYSDLRAPVYLLDAEARVPSPGTLAARPLGYFAATLLWLVLLLIAVGVAFFALPGLLSAGGVETLRDAPGLQGGNLVVGAVATLVLLPFILGSITGVILCASLGLFLSSATFFLRSLNSSYRGERLSATVRSVRAEAVGPASLFGLRSAFSLLPVRLTRWTKLVSVLSFQGLVVNLNVVVVGWTAGLFYIFTVLWPMWPATGLAVPVCAAISVVLFAFFLWVAWRFRGRYAEVMPAALVGTRYEHSWPNRPAPSRTKPTARRAASGSTDS